MTTIDDGGPAYPTQNEGQTGLVSYHYQGQSLRDAFAMAALTGMLASAGWDENSPDSVAEAALKYADAMLKARKR